jgi:hypothetical protein
MLKYICISHHLTICSCLNDPYPPLDPQKEDGHHRQTPISSSFVSSASQHHIQRRDNPHCGKYATARKLDWFQLVGTAMHDCEAYSLAFVFPHPSTNLTNFTSLPRFSISFSSFCFLLIYYTLGVSVCFGVRMEWERVT